MKILIVDDNADDRKLLWLNLVHHGCAIIIEAIDGEQGLIKAKEQKPDLIISDALMPKMDGFQFLRAIKTDEELKSIPFVFFSAVYTGYKEEELARSLGAEEFIIKPKDQEEFWKQLQKIMENCKINKTKEVKKNLIEEEKEFLKKYSHIVALKLEEKVIALEKARNLVSEMEKNLLQSQKMESIGMLAGGIAHDFNNILMTIIGYASIMQMKIDENDPLRFNLDQILASSEKAAVLTRSLLAFGRKQLSRPEYLDLNEIVKETGKIILRVIGEDIELEIILSKNKLPVMVDSGQMDQVFMNLITNSRDAMPKGGKLTIRTKSVDFDQEYVKILGYVKEGKYACITISDSGMGIDASIKDKIFEPFFTTKEVGRGTGLGLPMVYGIIKQHNGYINFSSELEKGTTFKIYLPLIDSISGITKETVKPVISASETGTETILLAEDDLSIRKLLKNILEVNGYKVIEAADGEEAINEFQQNKDKIDLLILDIIMPKLNGQEVFERIKKIKPEIKILMTSGYPMDFLNKKGIIEQDFNFIAKPVSPVNILRKVREVLEKK